MKNILITGGTSGIGNAILNEFHQNKWNVYFTFSKSKINAKKIENNYKNTQSLNLDLNSKSSIDKIKKKINNKLDCLILNAADTVFVDKNNFKKLTPDLFEKYININLIAQYRIIYNLLEILNDNCNIILISSIASKNGVGSNVAYSSSKAGLNNLAISLSKILGERIQINCIAPGLMKTKFTSQFSYKYFKEYKLKTPSKKLTTPKNIAEIALSICLNFKNFTGQTIFVDGGSS